MLILLTVCIAVDGATQTDTISNIQDNAKPNITDKSITYLNGTYYVNTKTSGQAITDGKVYTEKPKKPKIWNITMTGKPSCSRCARNGCAYTWRTKTYKNYCPNCKHYNCLGNKHKWQSRHEQEITCFRCDSDFCVNCGKEKYSWSRVYLKKP